MCQGLLVASSLSPLAGMGRAQAAVTQHVHASRQSCRSIVIGVCVGQKTALERSNLSLREGMAVLFAQ